MMVANSSGMLERLATRVFFWSALTVIAAMGGVLSVGADLSFVATAFGADMAIGTLLPAFSGAATILSLAAFGLALAGIAFLRRSRVTVAGASEANDRALQLQVAMQANAEGVFLLRTVRDATGAIVDFEVRDVNASGARLLRSEPQQLTGRRLRRDFPAALHESVFARYVEAITLHTPLVEDVRVSRRQFAGGWLFHQAVPTGEGVAVTLRDISQRKREESRLRRASLTDELTQLYNRRGFLSLADQQLRIARRQDRDAVLMYVDMDGFKDVNDHHGHAEGDRALAAVGRLLRRAVRDCDVVARLGGDEFTIMALDADRASARLIQRRIEDRIALLNASGELAAPLSLTIGHTRVRPTDQASLTELLARADALLYARKRRRKLTADAQASARRRARASAPAAIKAPVKAPVKVPVNAVPPELADRTPYFPTRVAG
jgi:diguanylate cyclase (GGDEF)-like protein